MLVGYEHIQRLLSKLCNFVKEPDLNWAQEILINVDNVFSLKPVFFAQNFGNLPQHEVK